MIKLILVRHAITEDNKNKKLSGHIDSVLSEEGKNQIIELTEFLQSQSIDKIYTTTYSKTKKYRHNRKRLFKRNKLWRF